MNRAAPGNAAEWHERGLERQRSGDRAGALEAFSKAADLDRRVARYHHDLANALLDDGKIDRAISSFRRALRIDDSLAEAHNDLGTAYFQKGWHAEAEECFRKAIERKPAHGVAHANLGAALRAQGRLGDSRRAYQRALWLKLTGWIPRFAAKSPAVQPAQPESNLRPELMRVAELVAAEQTQEALAAMQDLERRHPEEPDVMQMHAIVLEQAKSIDAALARTRAAIAAKPDRAEYYLLLTRLLVKSGEHNAALEAALKALRLEPGSAEIHATIAGVLHPWRDDVAEQAAREAIGLDASSHAGHGNLAAALWGQGKLEEAERHAREAMRLKPAQIAYRCNLALILKDQGRIAEAREAYQALRATAAQNPKLAMDLGTLAAECDADLVAARRWYRTAQSLSDEPRPRLLEAMIDLAAGDFSAWERYEARKRVNDQRYQHSIFAHFPEWRGGEPPAAGLLVYGEQGLGDEIMFASLFPDLARQVADVTLVCDPRLGALFRRSFPSFKVIAEPRAGQAERAQKLTGIGAAVAAGSLGRLYRRGASEFPSHGGYLVPDAGKVAQWRERLAALGPGLKAGVSWIGGLQKTGRSRRSLSLEQMRPVLGLPGVSWISLQYTPASAEIAASGMRIAEFPGVTEDLDELAALVEALDIVVSVCNTTVHVAGALGKEVLVMAPFVPEWRYGLSGERMIWYPSARVFRQARYGDWTEVLAAVGKALATRTL
jgi:Flp pilus assembly protein TadD